MEKSGLILFNKPPGVTSFDALRDIKKSLGTGKVGHTGTLDKFAQGLLVVLVGRALRLSQYFTNCDKQYIGKICFGAETDTLDPEGSVIAQAPVPSRERVESVLSQFTGEIQQAPPAYSAIHVDGKRASDLARSGAVPEMKKRPVTVYKLELLDFQPPFAEIFVHCSSGTYIRSLARDIALAAESRAHLTELKRTQVAGFRLEERDEGQGTGDSLQLITKTVIETLGMPWLDVLETDAQKIKHGKPLEPIMKGLDQTLAAIFCEDTLIAVAEKKEGLATEVRWKYGCVIN